MIACVLKSERVLDKNLPSAVVYEKISRDREFASSKRQTNKQDIYDARKSTCKVRNKTSQLQNAADRTRA